ncbi:MAG TPA: hypothetical protein PKM17_14040, partial [Syntrophorhabdus sp.]|nr:hypothetical protein [Syntrophorhabdus sp.]
RGYQFGIGAYSCERPDIAITPLTLLVFGNILRLGIAESPYLITLDAFAWEIAKNLILILITSPTNRLKELYDGVLRNTGHSDSSPDGIALNQSCNYLFLFFRI